MQLVLQFIHSTDIYRATPMSQKRVRKRRDKQHPRSWAFICIVSSFSCARNTRFAYSESRELCWPVRLETKASVCENLRCLHKGVVHACGNTQLLDSHAKVQRGNCLLYVLYLSNKLSPHISTLIRGKQHKALLLPPQPLNHSFNKYFLNLCNMKCTVVGAVGSMGSKIRLGSCSHGACWLMRRHINLIISQNIS